MIVLEKLAGFWRWLNKDAAFGDMPSLASVSGEFSAAQHVYALFMRAVFLFSEAALIGLGFMSIPLFIWLFMTVLGFPSPFEFICALVTPLMLFLLLRKAHGAARAAVFDAIRGRAHRQQARDVPRENVALDATASTGGSPVAVSVDVEHEEPVRRA